MFLVIFLSSTNDRRELFSGGADIRKRVLGAKDSYVPLPGEKTIFPLTNCYYEATTALGVSLSANDFIVTNKRILRRAWDIVGVFGSESEKWISLIPPNSKDNLVDERTMQIKKIEYCEKQSGKDQKGNPITEPFFKIEAQRIIGSGSWKVYHPDAKEIVKLFKDSLTNGKNEMKK